LQDLLITPWIVPVKPDKIRIGAVRICAVMTALCRAQAPVLAEYYPYIPLAATFQVTKIAPDNLQVFPGHEEPVSVFMKRNTTHLPGYKQSHLIGSFVKIIF
jgi:hypothetical protein